MCAQTITQHIRVHIAHQTAGDFAMCLGWDHGFGSRTLIAAPEAVDL